MIRKALDIFFFNLPSDPAVRNWYCFPYTNEQSEAMEIKDVSKIHTASKRQILGFKYPVGLILWLFISYCQSRDNGKDLEEVTPSRSWPLYDFRMESRVHELKIFWKTSSQMAEFHRVRPSALKETRKLLAWFSGS